MAQQQDDHAQMIIVCSYCKGPINDGVCQDCGRPVTVLRLVPRANMPNEKLVAMLERLLENAKSGELKHISVACIWDTEQISWGCTAGVSYSKMLGAIANLQMAYFHLNE